MHNPQHTTHSLTHSLARSLAHSLTHSLYLNIHTHTNSPTITAPSLLYFLFPSCFSMPSLSLEKLVTCGVIRSFNCIFTLTALRPTTARTFSTASLPKVLRTGGAFNILTSKCASHHSGARFLKILTCKSARLLKLSKVAPDVRCIYLFDFQSRFAPQRRAVFDLSSRQIAPHRPL